MKEPLAVAVDVRNLSFSQTDSASLRSDFDKAKPNLHVYF